ncbi:hypothetical protein RF641_04640 [Arthrobacter sp. LS16]|uniref:hypothetical protein n=1 Tax=Arthrobacter sp. 'calajunan' TaxID=1690248 RepID=UPI003C72B3FA
MVFTVMAALAQMEVEIKPESNSDSVIKRRTTGGDLGGRHRTFTDFQIWAAAKLVKGRQTGNTSHQCFGQVPRYPLPKNQWAKTQ